MMEIALKETKDGIVVPIKVIIKASRNEIVGWDNGELKVKVAAVPEKGNANTELLKFLAKEWKLAKTRIQIIHGEASRHKKVCITGLSLAEFGLLLK